MEKKFAIFFNQDVDQIQNQVSISPVKFDTYEEAEQEVMRLQYKLNGSKVAPYLVVYILPVYIPSLT